MYPPLISRPSANFLFAQLWTLPHVERLSDDDDYDDDDDDENDYDDSGSSACWPLALNLCLLCVRQATSALAN